MKKFFSSVISLLLFSTAYATTQLETLTIVPNTLAESLGIEDSRVVSYTLTNNTSYVANDIVIDAGYDNSMEPVNISVQNNLCGDGLELAPTESCTFEVLIESTGTATSFNLTPQVCGIGCTLCFLPAPANYVHIAVMADQMVYIANTNDNSISLCSIAVSTGNIENCSTLTDPTFNDPIDIILNADSSLAYVANSGSDELSICPVNPNLTLGACVAYADASFNFLITGLYLDNVNSLLFSTATGDPGQSGTISICNVSGGTVNGCVTNGIFQSPIARITFSPLIGYVAEALTFGTSGTVDMCSLVTCTRNTGNGTFVYPLGVGLSSDNNLLYVPSVNSLDPGYTSTVSVCQIRSNGQIGVCTAQNDPTFDFYATPGNINATSGYLYLPNGTNNAITVCSLKADGSFYSCVNNTDLTFNYPGSVWVVPAPALFQAHARPAPHQSRVAKPLSKQCGVSS